MMSLHRPTTSALFLALTIFLVACSKVDIQWTEQVQLADGREILLKRSAVGKKISEVGGPGGWAAHEMTLEFASPEVKDAPSEWRTRWVPMLLDQDPKSREWFIVATFYTCTDWYDLGRPKLPYIEYRYRAGAWKQVELSQPLLGSKSNLLTGPRAEGESTLVTIGEKISRSWRAAPEYNTVVPTWKTTC